MEGNFRGGLFGVPLLQQFQQRRLVLAFTLHDENNEDKKQASGNQFTARLSFSRLTCFSSVTP